MEGQRQQNVLPAPSVSMGAVVPVNEALLPRPRMVACEPSRVSQQAAHADHKKGLVKSRTLLCPPPPPLFSNVGANPSPVLRPFPVAAPLPGPRSLCAGSSGPAMTRSPKGEAKADAPLRDIPAGFGFFTGPWTVTRSSLRMLRRVAAFCGTYPRQVNPTRQTIRPLLDPKIQTH